MAYNCSLLAELIFSYLSQHRKMLPSIPFEDMSAEVRRDIRERDRLTIAALDRRSCPETAVLSDIAAQSLGLQHRLEDLLLSTTSMAIPTADRTLNITSLRLAIAAAAAIFDRATTAAGYVWAAAVADFSSC